MSSYHVFGGWFVKEQDWAAVRRRGMVLFDQQMWCWGRDVHRPQGNLLLRRGLERLPPPAGARCSSVYREKTPHRVLTLQGHAVFVGLAHCGGLVLRRYAFEPQWTPLTNSQDRLWEPECLPGLRRVPLDAMPPAVTELLCEALTWIAAFEEWVRQEAGLEHRRAVVAEWKKARVPAENMAAEWRTLAERIRHLATTSTPSSG